MIKLKMMGLKNKVKKLANDERGMELLQIVILCIIAIIIGGALLGYFTGAFDEIGGLMTTKIKSIFKL